MKVGRQFLGKYVELTWKDPVGMTRKGLDCPENKGWAALATWVERGLIDDMTDGVIRVRHGDSFYPGKDTPDEAAFTHVPESLIQKIVVFEPVQAPQPGPEEPS